MERTGHPSDARITAHARGDLTRRAATAIERHLAYCADCRERLAAAEELEGRRLDNLPPTPLAVGAFQRVMDRLRDPEEMP